MTKRLVVGVAVERDGRWLVARRTRPAQLAGRWEFPGGKLEPGESIAQAARRELREELAIDITVTGELPGIWPINGQLDMVIVLATAVGEPRPGESHDQIAWVTRDGLNEVAWVPADVAPARLLATGE